MNQYINPGFMKAVLCISVEIKSKSSAEFPKATGVSLWKETFQYMKDTGENIW